MGRYRTQRRLNIIRDMLVRRTYITTLLEIGDRCLKRAPTSKLLQQRSLQGAYANQVRVLLDFGKDRDFKRFLGMTRSEFMALYTKVFKKIKRSPRGCRALAITAKEKLAFVLSYLRTGTALSHLTTWWLSAQQTLGVVLRQVLTAIIDILSVEADCRPATTEDWKKISRRFFERWQLPNCLGSIDGKHVWVVKFGRTGSELYNYKGFNSIVLMIIADADYRIIHMNAGAPGSRSDGGVFK